MENVVRSPFSIAGRELIAKLVKSGYLRPAQSTDPSAIEGAILQMKDDLRSGSFEVRKRDRDPPAA